VERHEILNIIEHYFTVLVFMQILAYHTTFTNNWGSF